MISLRCLLNVLKCGLVFLNPVSLADTKSTKYTT